MRKINIRFEHAFGTHRKLPPSRSPTSSTGPPAGLPKTRSGREEGERKHDQEQAEEDEKDAVIIAACIRPIRGHKRE